MLATAGAAQTAPSILEIDDVTPGMRGYGMSVFRGTQPERFDVEVIDVLHNFRPGQDLILARTPHPLLDRAIAVGGMSGSPIYLDGKLAGAYAYGWPFGTEPVVGITPIRIMLEEMTRPIRPDAFPGAEPLGRRAGAPGSPRANPRADARPEVRHSAAGLPPYLGRRTNALAPIAALTERLTPSSEAPGLRPATTPVMLGGLTDRVAALLRSQLEPFGLVPLQASGGGGTPEGPRAFQDGGAIGVQLMRGDIDATAVGTVTHVGRGDRVIAFGHPMMNAGQIGLPTATAKVLHVFTSASRSFKIAEAEHPLGTLVHDRQSAIVIDTGIQPALVPVQIRIHGVEGAPKTEWHVEVASHRALTPMLIFSALANAVGATDSDQTDVVFEAEQKVGVLGQGTIALTDRGYMFAGPGDARALSSLRGFDLMEAAYGNPFEESRVTSVEIDLHVRYARDVLELVDARVAEGEVDPGSTVNLRLTMRRYGEPERLRIVPIRIPHRAAGESLTIEIEPGWAVENEHGQPRNLRDVVDTIEDAYPATSLIVQMKLPSRGLRFQGHVVQSLPGSALDALQLANGTEPGRPFETVERHPVDVGAVVGGAAKLELKVRDTPRGR